MAGLTQTAAAVLIYKKLRTWQQWEAGTRKMDPALWELWTMKAPTPVDGITWTPRRRPIIADGYAKK